jgi:hypothetical protein
LVVEEREGYFVRKKLTKWTRRKENPRGEKTQESIWSRLEFIPRGAVEGIRLFRWEKVAGAPVRGRIRFCRKAQERKNEFERIHGPRKRRKALKSESQERWELRDTPQALES